MITLIVKKAFPKGVIYEVFAQLTGEAEREVNFEVSSETTEILRTIRGFENFDYKKHVLRNIKQCTGAKEPRSTAHLAQTVARKENEKTSSTFATCAGRKGTIPLQPATALRILPHGLTREREPLRSFSAKGPCARTMAPRKKMTSGGYNP